MRSSVGMKSEINKRKTLLGYNRHEALTGILFALPWILGFLLFTAYPIGASLFYSFTNYNSFTITRIGFFNFANAFRDVFVADAFKNTLIFVFINVPISTVLGIALGMLLTRKTFGQKFYRTVFYLPAVVSVIASTFLWQWLFNENYGPINKFLGVFGVEGPGWLTDESWIKPALLVMCAWGVGSTVLLYLTAINNVPADQYEASEIDGAGKVKQFFKITLPNIAPIISFNVLMGLIGGFQYFLPAYIMTAGGPGRSATFLGQIIYANAFQQNNMGYASAVSWLLMAIIFCFTLLYFKLSARFLNG